MGISTKELRIGNLVEYDGLHCEVKLIEESGLAVMFEDGEEIWIDIWQFCPISITEKWLLKFGFEKVPKKDYMTLFLSEDDENEFSRQRVDFWFGDKDFQAAELCRSGVCFKRVKMSYVHQLQNLYYFLMGKELSYE
mgnify:CR=1 FL=1